MRARIYIPTKNAMQSVHARDAWVLEFTPSPNAKFLDNVMGWTSSSDMMQEVKIHFPTKELAVEFAVANNIDYEVLNSPKHKIIKKNYADNFR